jgi:hypothetical protein
MLDQVEEWIRTPDSPNLYWALANLPQPFIDLHKAYEGERIIIDNLLPGFRDALAKRSAQPLSSSAMDKLFGMVSLMPDDAPRSGFLTIMAMKKYPGAKEYLRSHGWSSETVESLPALQVVLLAEVATYDRIYDEMTKWVGMPYAQAQAGFAKADNDLKREAADASGMSLARMLIPATLKVAGAANRVDCRVAALRVIEAIRLYAAEHGRLPTSLAEITQVPIPANPATGAPFTYNSDGTTATLSVPSPSGAPATSIKYEISIRK